MADRILVTGASGLLGANFVLAALQRRKHVAAVCHAHPLSFPGAETIVADLTDADGTEKIVRAWRPDWIVHCAALTDVDWCETHPEETWAVNVGVTRNLAVLSRACGSDLVYISTDSVFDGKRGHYTETDSLAPLNEYARSKQVGEEAVQAAGGRYLIVRTNIYGWNATDKMSLAEWMLSRLERGQIVPGFTDVAFSPILVNDLSDVILDMLERQLTGLYHVAGAESCSKYEFACQLAEVFGLDQDLVQLASAADAGFIAPRPQNTSLQTMKVSKVVGRPMPDVVSGLQHFKALRDSGFAGQLKRMKGV